MNILIRDTDKKVTDVLKLMSEGHNYNYICQKLLLTPVDIFLTAKITYEIITKMAELRGSTTISATTEFIVKDGRMKTLDTVRKKHPRAFEPWGKDEDNSLMGLYQKGKSIAEIASVLQRSHGSIKARIERLFPGK